MALPSELRQEITFTASMQGFWLGYALGAFTIPLNPWEDTIMIERGGPFAYRIYDELLRDPRLFGIFRKRVKETTSQEWEVIPAGGAENPDATDTRAADIVKAQLEKIGFNRYQTRRLGAIMKGLSIGEVIYREPASRREAGTLGNTIAHAVKFRKPWAFRWVHNPETGVNHLHFVGEGGVFGALAGSIDLTELHPRQFVTYSWGSEYEDPYGKGLGHQLYWPVFFKRQDLKSALIYADKFAMPTVDISVDVEKLKEDGYNEKEIKQMIADAKEEGKKVSTEGVLSHSNAFVMELLEAQRRGDIQTYTDLLDYCDREFAIAVLGSTLAVDLQGEGARAATETHQGDIRQLAEEDAGEVCQDDSETLVKWISELNVPDATPPIVRRQFPDTTDYKGLAETHETVMVAVEKGLDVQFAERTFNIEIARSKGGSGKTVEPEPEDDNENEQAEDDDA